MNYYQFHIGDYASHTKHLTLLEDLAYRRMLDLYYMTEKPLPIEIEKLARLIGMRDHIKEVSDVVSDFFLKTETGYISDRCDREIISYSQKAERAKAANNTRWAKKKECNLDDFSENHLKSDANNIPTNNQEPITKNQEPLKTKSCAEALDSSFEIVWLEYPSRPGASKKESKKAWITRIKSGASQEEILAGVKAYAAYVSAMQTPPEFIKQPATFFGPGEHYKSAWTIPSGDRRQHNQGRDPDRRMPKRDDFDSRDYGQSGDL